MGSGATKEKTNGDTVQLLDAGTFDFDHLPDKIDAETFEKLTKEHVQKLFDENKDPDGFMTKKQLLALFKRENEQSKATPKFVNYNKNSKASAVSKIEIVDNELSKCLKAMAEIEHHLQEVSDISNKQVEQVQEASTDDLNKDIVEASKILADANQHDMLML